jgi:ABC-2 type transport system permease protein
VNIFFRELRSYLKSILIWSGITILFSLVGYSKFSAFYKNPELLAMLDSMPPALLSAFSMNAFNLTTLSGFYGVMIVFWGLILSISAAMWGSDIISKEVRDKTVEFALTLPVTRRRLITAKVAAAFANCALLLLVTWGITVGGARNFNPDKEFYRFVSVSMISFLLMQVIFLALGVFLGCAMKKHKRAGSAAVSILLGSYFVSVLQSMNKDLGFLKYFTPFKYFDPGLMLRESRIETSFIILSVGIAVALVAGAYAAYAKRDFYI